MVDFADKDKLFCDNYNALFILEYPTAMKLLRRLIEIADECLGDRRYRNDFTYERFALPIFNNDGEIERFNVFNACLLIRHAADGKKYLYDILEIKKETK